MLQKFWWRLVRFGFRLLYNEFAFTYDSVSWFVSLGEWRAWQRSALRHLPPTGRILELAHGTGNLQLDLHAAGYQTIGYDLSPYMGQITRYKLERKRQPVSLARGFAQELPFADESFNAIIATFPTQFIVEAKTLHEAYRVLEKGGLMIVVLNGVLTGNGALQRFLEWLYRITGQREESQIDLSRYFTGAVFDIEIVQERCPKSLAQLVLLRKASSARAKSV